MKRVVIVDDDHVVHYYLRVILRKTFPEISILSFFNGNDALNYLVSNNLAELLPDYIILDINMPVMTGWEFLNKLDDLSGLSKIPKVIMSSSSSSQNDIAKAFSFRFVCHFITKPIEVDQLSYWLR